MEHDLSRLHNSLHQLQDMSTMHCATLTTARTARPFERLFALCRRCSHRFYSRAYVKENDIVLLKKRRIDDSKPILTKLLQPTGKVHTPRGSIDHANLIGKEIRDVVYTHKGVAYRIYQPTLAEYVTLSPRIVTPIYPADANLILSLLDIHPSIDPEDCLKSEPFEIFEAGTGHGALTLHLARAIHGMNPAPPPFLSTPNSRKASVGELATENPMVPKSDQDTSVVNGSLANEPNHQEEYVDSYGQGIQPISEETAVLQHKSVQEIHFEAYLTSRRAVIHTLDISPDFSKHAQSVVRNFRRGLYYHNIDFHVGTISGYLSSRLATAPEPFLEHTILDLPNSQEHLEIIGQALKPNGSLIVFCPSITQIVDCVKLVAEKMLPFYLESVLELGAGAGVGGREWDVRLVRPRALLNAEAEVSKAKEQSGAASVSDLADNEKISSHTSENSQMATVCRPKVGGTVTGGGFLALWRRISQGSAHGPQPVNTVEIEPTTVGEPEHEN